MPRKPNLTTLKPLSALWSSGGQSDAKRVRALDATEVDALLAAGPVQFVVADGALTLEWVPAERSADFWISEVRPRLVAPRGRRSASPASPGQHRFAAAEWITDSGAVVVLLERLH